MKDPWEQDGGRGVVVGYGAQPWMVMVKFPVVGTRSVPIDHLTKVVSPAVLIRKLLSSHMAVLVRLSHSAPHEPLVYSSTPAAVFCGTCSAILVQSSC